MDSIIATETVAVASTPPEGIVIPEGIERRCFALREMRVAAAPDGKRKLEGYAAVFDVLSEPMWGFREKIAKGAFTKTIGEADIRALFNHDPNYVLGRNAAGTLSLAEDENGLAIVIFPPDNQWARDLLVTIERGDVNQMSFSFNVVREEWLNLEDGTTIRTIKEAKLWDVSPVTYPAYPQTSINARSALDLIGAAMRHFKPGEVEPAALVLLRDFLGKSNEQPPAAPTQASHPAGNASEDEAGASGAAAQVRLGLLRKHLELVDRS
jgi:hypothetical protein